jgi:hypothetical protein
VGLTTKDTKSTKDEFAGRAGFECLRINLERSVPDVCSEHCIHASSGFTFAFPFVHFVSFVVPLAGLGARSCSPKKPWD